MSDDCAILRAYASGRLDGAHDALTRAADDWARLGPTHCGAGQVVQWLLLRAERVGE